MSLCKTLLLMPFLCQLVACEDKGSISVVFEKVVYVVHKAKQALKQAKKVEEEIVEGANQIIAEIAKNPEDEEEDSPEEEEIP